jgi:hypothetical protein
MRLSNIAFAFLLLAVCSLCKAPATRCWAEAPAPAGNGGEQALRGQEKSTVLLAFLALTAKETQATSRATAVILQSLDHQYSSRGLRVVAVDATAVFSHRASQRADVVNRVADWNLKFQVLEDPVGSRAQALHIHILPTIVLISDDGKEVSRWEGYTRTPVLAQAIERLLGGPLGSLPDAASQPEKGSGLHRIEAKDVFAPAAVGPDLPRAADNSRGTGPAWDGGESYFMNSRCQAWVLNRGCVTDTASIRGPWKPLDNSSYKPIATLSSQAVK